SPSGPIGTTTASTTSSTSWPSSTTSTPGTKRRISTATAPSTSSTSSTLSTCSTPANRLDQARGGNRPRRSLGPHQDCAPLQEFAPMTAHQLAALAAAALVSSALAQPDAPPGAPVVRYDGHRIVRVMLHNLDELRVLQGIGAEPWVCTVRTGPCEFRVPPGS